MNTQETNQTPDAAAQAIAPAPPVAPPVPQPVAAAPTAGPVRRSPGLAVVLSCFPGLGHLYLGLYQRALAIFASFVFAIWLSEHSTLGILIAGVVLFGFVDAYRQAQALNLGLLPEPLSGIAAKPAGRSGGKLGFGIFLLLGGLVLLYDRFYPIDFTFLEDWWPLVLVLFGVYLVVAHFLQRQRQAKREAELGVPHDPTRGM